MRITPGKILYVLLAVPVVMVALLLMDVIEWMVRKKIF